MTHDNEDVKAGQTIQVDGMDAIVFAISKDSSYITVTSEIFDEFQMSQKELDIFHTNYY